MDRLTLTPWLVALIVGIAQAPTDIYKVCAWNAGTLKLEPWRRKTLGTLRSATQTIRAWLASLCTPRVAFACGAVLLALLVLHQTAAPHGVLLATVPAGAALKAKRAKLVREANALRNADGTFADDDARAKFDAKMTEIEQLDARSTGASETIVERGLLDTPADQVDDAEAAEPTDADRAVAAERSRVQGITQACRAARMPQATADKLIADGVSLVDAQTRIFQELQARNAQDRGPMQPSGTRVEFVGEDPLVHVRAGIENALLHRMHPRNPVTKQGFELTDEGRQYRGMTILDAGRRFLEARGIRTTSMSRMDLAGALLGFRAGGYHTTSDFANILADLPNKLLRQAYLEAPQTFGRIVRYMTLADFKKARLLQLGEAPALLAVGEHGEYLDGTIGDSKEEIQLSTYGRKFSITRQALVNDDTDAFSRVPMAFGRQARNKESDLVWAEITNNAAMNDTIALFHASHNNLSGTSDALSVAAIGAGRTAMRRQTGIDGVSLMNLNPVTLIVPATKETLADQFVSTNLLASQSSSVNPFAGKLTVVAEPRLDVNSTTAWYLAASPDQIDMIVLATLEGENGPRVDSRVGFEVDGIEIKISHDVAAKAVDFRGLYKNAGA